MIRFFWNGLKVDRGPLVTCYVSFSRAWSHGDRSEEAYVSFSARHYRSLPDEVCKTFKVRNDTDLQSDYFDNDRFKVTVGHPLFPNAAKACIVALERSIARCERRGDRSNVSVYHGDLAELRALLAARSAPPAEVAAGHAIAEVAVGHAIAEQNKAALADFAVETERREAAFKACPFADQEALFKALAAPPARPALRVIRGGRA